jgi:hypothetical protein
VGFILQAERYAAFRLRYTFRRTLGRLQRTASFIGVQRFKCQQWNRIAQLAK